MSTSHFTIFPILPMYRIVFYDDVTPWLLKQAALTTQSFRTDCVIDRLLFSLRRDTTQNTNKTHQKHKTTNQQLLNLYTYLFK